MNDLIVTNGSVFTLDNAVPYLSPGAIVIDDGRIVAVGSADDIRKEYSGDVVIDAHGKVIMPGLINGHDHFEQTFMKGLVRLYPRTTLRWIKDFKIPLTREMGPDDYYYSSMIACLEMIRSGITCGLNSICQQDPKKVRAFGLDKAASAVLESGVRTLISVSAADRLEPPDFLLSPKEAVDLVDWSISRWNGMADGRIRVWTGLGHIRSSTPELWRYMRTLAEERDVGLHVHIGSISPGEVEEAHTQGNLSSRITGAHCVSLSGREIEIMAKTGMKAVHCPTYKLGYSIDGEVSKFGDGIAPITDMVANGVTTGLGTDGCMGDTHDMFREMRNLAFTQHYKMRDKTIFPPPKLLEMATLDCAATMSWQSEIGSIEPGKKADIIIVDNTQASSIPWTNPVACLVYLTSGSDVETVIVDGNVVMENRQIRTVDEAQMLQKAQSAAERLIDRAGFRDLVNRGLSALSSDYRL